MDGLNLNGIVLYPEAVAKANEDFRSLSSAYTTEKASRQETFEAALKRATRRANDAEHKLQDTSQNCADKIKSNDEAHTKIVEALRQEVTDLTISLTDSRESLKTASESAPLRATLLEKEAQLARHEQLCLQLTSEKEKLDESQARAALNANALKVQHEKQSKIVDQFINDWEEVTVKTLKRYATEMKEGNQIIKGLVIDDFEEWEKIKEVSDRLGKTVAAIAAAEIMDGVAGTTPTTTTTAAEATAVAVETAVADKPPLVKCDEA